MSYLLYDLDVGMNGRGFTSAWGFGVGVGLAVLAVLALIVVVCSVRGRKPGNQYLEQS
jgi:uncharacterized membrane protein YhiD involved in acid resistance